MFVKIHHHYYKLLIQIEEHKNLMPEKIIIYQKHHENIEGFLIIYKWNPLFWLELKS